MGITALTSPMASASLALTILPVRRSSYVFLRPMILGNHAAATGGKTPTAISGWPNPRTLGGNHHVAKGDELAPPSEGHAVHLCDDRDIDLEHAAEHAMEDRDHFIYLVLRVVRNVDAARERLLPA